MFVFGKEMLGSVIVGVDGFIVGEFIVGLFLRVKFLIFEGFV